MVGSQYIVGDDANQNEKLPAYWVANLHRSYQLTKELQVFGIVNNLFNQKYATFGTYFEPQAIANAVSNPPTDQRTDHAGAAALGLCRPAREAVIACAVCDAVTFCDARSSPAPDAHGLHTRNGTMLRVQRRGGGMPIRDRVVRLPIAVGAALLCASALAADRDAFLAGASRNCTDCDLFARDLKERDFKRAKLDRAKLNNADLSGASLFRASLVRADLAGAKLKDANLNLVDAKWADLAGADLTDALLYEADLAGANLARANLQRARLGRARLNQADLQRANLTGADLRGARLAGAKLKGADMRFVKLDNQNLR